MKRMEGLCCIYNFIMMFPLSSVKLDFYELWPFMGWFWYWIGILCIYKTFACRPAQKTMTETNV